MIYDGTEICNIESYKIIIICNFKIISIKINIHGTKLTRNLILHQEMKKKIIKDNMRQRIKITLWGWIYFLAEIDRNHWLGVEYDVKEKFVLHHVLKM